MQQTEFEQNAARRLSLDRAARAVTQGQVILYPTETFYAIGCGAFHPHAAELVSQIKHRPPGKPFPLILGSVEQLHWVTNWMSDTLRRLADCFWPGPLSILVPGLETLCEAVRDPSGFTAVRVSGHPAARELCLRTDTPLIATSANLSGEQPVAHAKELNVDLLKKAAGVLDSGPQPAGGVPSTLVRLHDDALVILREGAVSRDALQARGFSVLSSLDKNF